MSAQAGWQQVVDWTALAADDPALTRRQRGFTQTVTFEEAGTTGAVTLCVTEADWDESMEQVDVTAADDNGVTAVISGNLNAVATISGVVDNANLVHTLTAIRSGSKGKLTISVGGQTPFSIPIMVVRLRHSFRMKTAVTYTFDATLDALSGTYTRATDKV